LQPIPVRPAPDLVLVDPPKVRTNPAELADMLPPDTEALVAVDDHSKITIKARSNRGFPLFCEWTASLKTANSYGGSSTGTFSSSQEVVVSVATATVLISIYLPLAKVIENMMS
jgi:hypothetical protein